MKLFVLLSRIPYPLEKGDKLRAFNQIKQLSKHNEIVLCALNTNKKLDKQQAFKALQPYCVSINFFDLSKIGIGLNVFKAGLKGLPLQIGYFYNRKTAKKIQELINRHQPDLLYGQLLRVAQYIRYNELPKVIDYQDVFSEGMKRRMKTDPWWKKPFFWMEYKRLQKHEVAVFDDFDIKTIISKPDRDLIAHPNSDQILIIANGVDYDFFRPKEHEKIYDLVFTGNMGYPPNSNAVSFLVKDILPLVWKKRPETRILIAGASPNASVRCTASEKATVSGWIKDIRDAYAQSRVFIAPMRIGTGLQNKLLEAMSMRLPAITTSLANSALKAKEDVEILVGDDAETLAKHILMLLDNSEKADKLAQAGYEFVHKNYDWSATTAQLEKSMQQVVNDSFKK
ncbi:MAG: glycosyltransferase [Lentimicrobiaceae bacterium]|jgi:sugar transferase (PEP-CTERM/EpsH1 system associated)|nr:glycosyltransferase [Lentimicrobiaceae bacterium]